MENTTIVPSGEVVDIPVVDAPPHDENPNPPIIQYPLRRSERTRRPVVHDDFITYLNEDDYDLGKLEDPIFYKDAFNSNQSTQWLEAMTDESHGILGLSQRAYIDKILTKYSMQNCSPIVAPVVKVRSLTYAHLCTPPGIAYITGMVGRYQSNPGKEHWKVAKKCKDSSRSTSWYIFMLSGGPTLWRSHKQELTTTSTMMAEYVACYHAASHAILLRNLISRLKVVDSISRPLRLYCDNSSAVRFSNNTSSTRAGLYLETKYLYVREKVEDNSIVIEYIALMTC
ncbi:hypothetical protein Tco_1209990 [Tanacetum coccineum]